MGFPLRFPLRLAPARPSRSRSRRVPRAPRRRRAACPAAPPVLTGPASIQAGETYSASWTNVLGNVGAASAANYYQVERALDAAFTTLADTTATQRSALTFAAAPEGAPVLYHRVLVRTASACPASAALVSNVLAVPVKTVCDAPASVGQLSASPENPPAFSTWVVSWNTFGAGPGPGGGFSDLRFRIRRTSALEPDGREWVVEGGSASFTGPPGDYVFEVRAEAECGAVGPWSPPKKVTVGTVVRPSLVLVSEPAPIAGLAPAAAAKLATSFTVRNAGTEPVTATTKCDDSGFALAPAQFTLAPGATQEIRVTSLYATVLTRPVKTAVAVSSGATTLSIPILCMLSAAPAAQPVAWNTPAADIDVNGTAVTRSLVNAGASPAPFVASVRAPWISVESLDGLAWDRPLAPFETRPVRIVIDRAKRRGETGTEVGAIVLSTVGFATPQRSS